jgi:hypothetical protein
VSRGSSAGQLRWAHVWRWWLKSGGGEPSEDIANRDVGMESMPVPHASAPSPVADRGPSGSVQPELVHDAVGPPAVRAYGLVSQHLVDHLLSSSYSISRPSASCPKILRRKGPQGKEGSSCKTRLAAQGGTGWRRSRCTRWKHHRRLTPSRQDFRRWSYGGWTAPRGRKARRMQWASRDPRRVMPVPPPVERPVG